MKFNILQKDESFINKVITNDKSLYSYIDIDSHS